MPRRRITVGFASGEEPTLTLETKIRNSRDASVRQCYSKRRTDELKPPDAQTVALGSPAELSRNSRMNLFLQLQSIIPHRSCWSRKPVPAEK